MSSTAKDSVTAERIIEDYAKVLEHSAVLGGIYMGPGIGRYVCSVHWLLPIASCWHLKLLTTLIASLFCIRI